MNRFSNGIPEMLAEMRAVAPHIRDYADYIREFLQLSEHALRAGETLKATYYPRSAEFYMCFRTTRASDPPAASSSA